MTLTKERIDHWREFFRDVEPGDKDELDALCDLALIGSAVQPRPIEKAPRDGITRILAWSPHWLGWNVAIYTPHGYAEAHYMPPFLHQPAHFVLLSAFPKPEAVT